MTNNIEKRGSSMKFTFENSGSNTYLVYEISNEEKIDTICIGMVTNNDIEGIVPFIFTQMDSKKYLKYNITSKITLERFLASTVTRMQLLNVFSSIANAIINVEDYMIDLDMLLLDMEHIYVNVGSYQAQIIPLPFKIKSELSLSDLFKNIMSNTQFDTTENSDYVGRIISFLNRPGNFSINEFLQFIKELKNAENLAKPQPKIIETPPVINAQPHIQQNSPMQNIPKTNKNSPPIQMPQAPQQQQQAPPQMQIVQQGSVQNKKPKKKGIFSRKKEAKPIKTKSGKMPNTQFAVPGESLPITQHGKIDSKPAPNKKNVLTAGSPTIKGSRKVEDYASPPIKSPALIEEEQNMRPFTAQSTSFGETTVLSSESIGETTVLTDTSNPQSLNPHLTRVKTNQVTFINKSVLRIGAEKSYVDFYLGDNPAISRSHADIIMREGKFYIVDNNSTNQTYIDGEIIPSGTEIEIFHGTIITLADEKFEFNLF